MASGGGNFDFPNIQGESIMAQAAPPRQASSPNHIQEQLDRQTKILKSIDGNVKVINIILVVAFIASIVWGGLAYTRAKQAADQIGVVRDVGQHFDTDY